MSNANANAGFWDDFAKGGKKSSGGKIVNLKLEAKNEAYQLRLIGDPFEFTKLFYNGKSVVLLNPRSPLVDRLSGANPPSTKYACLVIDRADGVLKVVEVPATPLKPLMSWRKMKKRDPGGPNGCDWGIDVNGTGKDKRYTGLALDDSPLTPEETKMIEDANIILEKLYKPSTDEEAEAKLLGGSESNSGPKPAQRPAQSVGATTQIKNADIPF
jgi:hypothetical protein